MGTTERQALDQYPRCQYSDNEFDGSQERLLASYICLPSQLRFTGNCEIGCTTVDFFSVGNFKKDSRKLYSISFACPTYQDRNLFPNSFVSLPNSTWCGVGCAHRTKSPKRISFQGLEV